MSSLFKAVNPSSAGSSSKAPDGAKQNKQRVLILSSRGVTYRQRHLLNDLVAMLPHARKDSKLDTKSKLYHLNEVAELYNCNNVLFFEARKRQDLYMWLSKAPNGPCVKFHVQNLHTMSELNFTGNALKGSRPIVSFDASFDAAPATALMKEMLLQTFGVPKGARKSKPFIDRVVSFSLADGKVWLRHFQITTPDHAGGEEGGKKGEEAKKGKEQGDGMALVEIGPRCVFTPIVVLEGSFGGPVVYENREFVSPNAVRSALRQRRAAKAVQRDVQSSKRDVKMAELMKKEQKEIDDAVLFA